MDERRVRREGREVDPRKSEQRRGESDVDWGDDSDDDGEVRELGGGIGGMEIDDGEVDRREVLAGEDGGMQVDVGGEGEGDLQAMVAFVKGMGAEGSRHVTMDELEDEERMKREDAEEETRGGKGSSGEESDGDEMDED